MVKRTIVVHSFDGVHYVAINGGPMKPVTTEELRSLLNL